MNVKQSQLQPFLLSPIACGLILHTHAQRKEEREAYAKLVLHTVIKCGNKTARGERVGGGGGVAAQVQVPRCCLWQLWDFAFQPRRGPSSETYQRQLETVSVTKGCPWVTYDVLLCASVWCVCGCVCGWCVVCPLTCQQARLQYVSLHLTLVILFVFDSIITLFKMAFQPLSPEGGDSLPTPTHTHTETRN